MKQLCACVCVRVCALVSYMRRPACVFLSNFRSMLVLLLVTSLFERGFVAASATQSPRFLNETTSLLSVCVIGEKGFKNLASLFFFFLGVIGQGLHFPERLS